MKNKYIILLLALMTFSFGLVNAQHETCGFDHGMKKRMSIEVQANIIAEIEEGVASFIKDNKSTKQKSLENITIPIVFHVLYENTAENISDAKIIEQVGLLNEFFNAGNTNLSVVAAPFQNLIASINFNFCLASIDPNGNATTGITRSQIQESEISHNRLIDLGYVNNWNENKYINVYIYDLESFNGYSTFPSAATSFISLDYLAVGLNATHPTGRVNGVPLAHEIGHYFGLRHIFGDFESCEDFVDDTPPQESSTRFICPTFPTISTCGNGVSNGPNGDLFYNFMDYSHDNCRVMFTKGQKERIYAFLSLYRDELINSHGCGTLPTNNLDGNMVLIESPEFNSCGTSLVSKIKIGNLGSSTITSAEIIYGVAGNLNTYNWSGTLNTWQEASITLPSVSVANGQNDFSVLLNKVNGVFDDYAENDTLFKTYHTSNNLFPYLEDFETANLLSNDFMPQTLSPQAEFSLFYKTEFNGQNVLKTIMGRPFWKEEANCAVILKEHDISVLPDPYFKFDIGFLHTPAAGPVDGSFIIEVSTDCGQTYTPVLSKSTTQMNTDYPLTVSLYTDSVSLIPFGQSDKLWIRLRVEGSTNFGQEDVYLDNLMIYDINGVSTTDINNQDFVQNQIKVFPNPGNNLLNISFSKDEYIGDYEFYLMDMMGRIKYSGQITNLQNYQVDIRNLAGGVYSVVLKNKVHGTSIIKFIKM